MNDEELAYQNAVQALYPTGNNANVSTMHSFSEPSFWDRASTFGKWAIGNKDFSPLQTFNALLGTGFDYFQHKDNYKIARDTLNNQMAMSRANLGSSIGNALGARADRAQMLAAWNPNAANDYVMHSQDIADSLIQLAGNAGVDTSAMNKYKNALDRYSSLGH